MDLLVNIAIFGGLGLGAWYGYTNNFMGIRQAIESMSMGGNLNIANMTGGMGYPPPPVMQTPTTGGMPFSPTGTVPNLSQDLKLDMDQAVDQSQVEHQALITRTLCMTHHSEHHQ